LPRDGEAWETGGTFRRLAASVAALRVSAMIGLIDFQILQPGGVIVH